MREIRPAGQFKRDYKRELRGPYGKTLAEDLTGVISALAADVPLDPAMSIILYVDIGEATATAMSGQTWF
jgi:hypothetical protein